MKILLSEVEAAAALGVSRRKFASWRKQPWMPVPINLGVRLLRWDATELQASVKKMPREVQQRPEPAMLKRARAKSAPGKKGGAK